MADKQATIYVIDVGSTTKELHNGRCESDLNFSLKYFWSKIAETMATNRSTLSVGVIAFRTDNTLNPLASEGYENISILKSLGKMEMADVEEIRSKLIPSSTETGDAISAIVVAIAEIIKFTQLKSGRPGKFKRKIVLITDGQGINDYEGSDEIIRKINESDIELVVIGIDFDDTDFGFKEEEKSFLKEQNESSLQDFVKKCNKGIFGTAAAAIQQTSKPSVKTLKAFLTYEGPLVLGDFKKYPDSSISFDVKRYFKTKSAKPPSASQYVIKTPIAANVNDNQVDQATGNKFVNSGDLSIVRNARSYTVNDPLCPGGKKDVSIDDLAKGYLYGRTIVPMNEADEGVTKFDTTQSFTIIGFIPVDEYDIYMNMGESCITVAQQHNDPARLAMSSLVHALHELESYAIARIVSKNSKDPSIVLLAPLIKPGELEALVDVPLPFAEDVRTHRFPPLDRVLTTSGTELTTHRNLPSNELSVAMSNYVDALDFSNFGNDDNDLFIENLSNPVIHRVNFAIRNKAMNPDQPISLPPEDVASWSKPPPKLMLRATRELEVLKSQALVNPVPPEVRGKRKRKSEDTPLSGLDIEAILAG
ncbi:ATP-dependent DNA helicase II subunit 2 [Erysiphe necator]|nr:ATP-dependent DNA helicase II subunit 2 [Erysiphe necator]